MTRPVVVLVGVLVACQPPVTASNDAGGSPGFDAGVSGDARQDAGFDRDAGTSDAGLDAGPCAAPSGLGAAFRLRAMAANLSSGSNQSYSGHEGQRLMQGVHPDVVLIQEFNYLTNTAAAFAAFANETLDGGTYFRGSGGIPNGVLSRWPIVASGEWADPNLTDRTFVWAKIDLPGPNDLWAISLHLHTKSAASRAEETAALVAQLSAMVPAHDFMLIGGDFNTDARSEAAVVTLSARVSVPSSPPADGTGNSQTNSTRSKPYDWVLASSCLDRLAEPVTIGSHTFDSGLVLDSRVYVPLTDLAPVQFGDSSATNMQHMGVVRDFLIQP